MGMNDTRHREPEDPTVVGHNRPDATGLGSMSETGDSPLPRVGRAMPAHTPGARRCG